MSRIKSVAILPNDSFDSLNPMPPDWLINGSDFLSSCKRKIRHTGTALIKIMKL